MSQHTFTQIKDGEGFEIPSGEVYALACCDCGLVHDVVVVSHDDTPVGIAATRNEAATRERRGAPKAPALDAPVLPEPAYLAGTDGMLGENVYDVSQMQSHADALAEWRTAQVVEQNAKLRQRLELTRDLWKMQVDVLAMAVEEKLPLEPLLEAMRSGLPSQPKPPRLAGRADLSGSVISSCA